MQQRDALWNATIAANIQPSPASEDAGDVSGGAGPTIYRCESCKNEIAEEMDGECESCAERRLADLLNQTGYGDTDGSDEESDVYDAS